MQNSKSRVSRLNCWTFMHWIIWISDLQAFRFNFDRQIFRFVVEMKSLGEALQADQIHQDIFTGSAS